ncbi:hypothetical protein ACP4OV_012229 [Aristida adscensionis]
MPRVLKEKTGRLGPLASASVAVVSFAVLLHGAAMPSLDTQLMVVTVVCQGLVLLQCILGPKRRHSRHWFVQYGAMAAYYLPFTLVVYAANTVRSSPSDTNLQLQYRLKWCMMLLLWSYPCQPYIFGMRTYNLGDSLIGSSRFLKSSFYLFFLIQTLDVAEKIEGNELFFCVNTLIIVLMMLGAPSKLISGISSTMICSSKAFADYMKREAKSPSPFFCDTTGDILEGCKYPIVKMKDGPWIKISDLVRCVEPDSLLSYSFFQLLARRYFGFDCAEEGNTVARDFVLKDLLLGESYNYKRAFTVVEKQLGFLHDYLFTTHMSMARIPCRFVLTRIPFIPRKQVLQLITLLMWLEMFVPICLMAQELSYITLAAVLFLNTMVIWWFHSEKCFATDGYTIWVAIHGYLTGRICNNIPSRSASWFREPYWQNKIGQYSIIEDYDRRSAKKILLISSKELLLCEWAHRFIKHHPMEEDSVRLDDSMRELVALTLQDINGPPTNGTRSLQRNRHQYRTMDDLSWTCREDTYTHTILIWHIATCYCGTSPQEKIRLKATRASYEVAISLSRYCAYLVAFLPEFLPEHKLTTQMVLQDVLQQAKKLSMVETRTIWEKVLQKAKGSGSQRISMAEKLSKIRELELPEQEVMTTFEKGVKLGRQLEQLETSPRWEVMAEFWAEAILYIAPSDNVAAHVEHLAKGGEFITHLWALLSNAGILKRARDES